MKLHINTHRLLSRGFVLMVAVLSVNLVLESRDYVQMYSSIGQVQFQILSLALQTSGPSESVVLIQVSADNPVDYTGLNAKIVDVSAYFFSGNSYLFKTRPLYATLTNQPLAANGATFLAMTMVMSPQNQTSLNSFYQTHSGSVVAYASLDAAVTTPFFTAIGTSPVVVLRQQNVTLS